MHSMKSWDEFLASRDKIKPRSPAVTPELYPLLGELAVRIEHIVYTLQRLSGFLMGKPLEEDALKIENGDFSKVIDKSCCLIAQTGEDRQQYSSNLKSRLTHLRNSRSELVHGFYFGHEPERGKITSGYIKNKSMSHGDKKNERVRVADWGKSIKDVNEKAAQIQGELNELLSVLTYEKYFDELVFTDDGWYLEYNENSGQNNE